MLHGERKHLIHARNKLATDGLLCTDGLIFVRVANFSFLQAMPAGESTFPRFKIKQALPAAKHFLAAGIAWQKCYLGNKKTEKRLATVVFLAWCGGVCGCTVTLVTPKESIDRNPKNKKYFLILENTNMQCIRILGSTNMQCISFEHAGNQKPSGILWSDQGAGVCMYDLPSS